MLFTVSFRFIFCNAVSMEVVTEKKVLYKLYFSATRLGTSFILFTSEVRGLEFTNSPVSASYSVKESIDTHQIKDNVDLVSHPEKKNL